MSAAIYYDSVRPITVASPYSVTVTSISAFSTSTSAVLLSDSYSISGIAGTNYACYSDYSHTDNPLSLQSGQVVTLTVSASNSVNFWVLTNSQYTTWKSTFERSCSDALAVPSVLTEADIKNYETTIQATASDGYHFVFDSANQNSVSVSVSVSGSQVGTGYLTQTATSETTTMSQIVPAPSGWVPLPALVALAVGVSLSIWMGRKEGGQVTCSHCNTRTRPAKFCPKCGNPLVRKDDVTRVYE